MAKSLEDKHAAALDEYNQINEELVTTQNRVNELAEARLVAMGRVQALSTLVSESKEEAVKPTTRPRRKAPAKKK